MMQYVNVFVTVMFSLLLLASILQSRKILSADRRKEARFYCPVDDCSGYAALRGERCADCIREGVSDD